MSDVSQGPGWWMASDHKWYPPELHPDRPKVAVPISLPASEGPLQTDVAGTPSWGQPQGVQRPFAVPATTTIFSSHSPGLASSPTRPKRRALVGALVGAGVLIVVVALVVVLGGTSGGLSGKSAAQVLATTVAAATAQGSVHLSATNLGASAGGSTYDIGLSTGQQTTEDGAQGNANFVVIPGHAYLKADAPFLQNSLAFSASSASQYAGRWISLLPTDSGYQQVVDGVTLSSALTDSTPTGAVTLTPTRTIQGQSVVGVSGGLAQDLSQSGAKGTLVLYVSTTAPYLPVEAVTSASLGNQSGTSSVMYSRWGESISATAPSGATPISSLSS